MNNIAKILILSYSGGIRTHHIGITPLDNIKGILSYDTYQIQKNQIADSLLKYINFELSQPLGSAFGRANRLRLFEDMDTDRPLGVNKNEALRPFGEGIAPKPSTVINIYGGQVNLGQTITQVAYNPNLGISKDDFNTLKSQVENLSQTNLDVVKSFIETEPEPTNEVEKQSISTKIYNWLNKNAEGIVGNVAASVYYDVLKKLLGIG